MGDWGGASDQIGRRWETLGAEHLRELLGQGRPSPDGGRYTPRAAVIISEEPEIAQEVHRGGKPHADAILVGCTEARTVLEPVDFKWSLETANARQVSREVLEALLTDPPPALRERVQGALSEAGSEADSEALYHTGFFLAPDYPPNRAQVAPHGPIDRELVVLCRVDPETFFSPLPGWDVAEALARVEPSRASRSLEAAERYYRLGAGVLGALRRLASGIFAEKLVELDGVAALAELRAQRSLRTTGEVVAYLDRAQRAQGELVERLREIERGVYPFSAFRRLLARHGIPESEERRVARLHGEVMKLVRAEMRGIGRRLVSQGRREQDALAELEAMRPQFTRLAQLEAKRRVEHIT